MERFGDQSVRDGGTNTFHDYTIKLEKATDPEYGIGTEASSEDEASIGIDNQSIEDVNDNEEDVNDNEEDDSDYEDSVKSLFNKVDKPPALYNELRIELRDLPSSAPFYTCLAKIDTTRQLNWISYSLVQLLKLPIRPIMNTSTLSPTYPNRPQGQKEERLRVSGVISLCWLPAMDMEYERQVRVEDFYVTQDRVDASVMIGSKSMTEGPLLVKAHQVQGQQPSHFRSSSQAGKRKGKVMEKYPAKKAKTETEDELESTASPRTGGIVGQETLTYTRSPLRTSTYYPLSDHDDQLLLSPSSPKHSGSEQVIQTYCDNTYDSDLAAKPMTATSMNKPALLNSLIGVTIALVSTLKHSARGKSLVPFSFTRELTTKFFTSLTSIEWKLYNTVSLFPALEAVFRTDEPNETETETVVRVIAEIRGTLIALEDATNAVDLHPIDSQIHTHRQPFNDEGKDTVERQLMQRLDHVIICITQFNDRVASALRTDHIDSLVNLSGLYDKEDALPRPQDAIEALFILISIKADLGQVDDAERLLYDAVKVSNGGKRPYDKSISHRSILGLITRTADETLVQIVDAGRSVAESSKPRTITKTQEIAEDVAVHELLSIVDNNHRIFCSFNNSDGTKCLTSFHGEKRYHLMQKHKQQEHQEYRALELLDIEESPGHTTNASSPKQPLLYPNTTWISEKALRQDQKRRSIELAVLIDQKRGCYSKALLQLRSLYSIDPSIVNQQWLYDMEIRLDWQLHSDKTTPLAEEERPAGIGLEKTNTSEQPQHPPNIKKMHDGIAEAEKLSKVADVNEGREQDQAVNVEQAESQRIVMDELQSSHELSQTRRLMVPRDANFHDWASPRSNQDIQQPNEEDSKGAEISEHGEPSPSKMISRERPRGPTWTPAEDRKLKTMRENGKNWKEIAKTFVTRTEGSIKKRWYMRYEGKQNSNIDKDKLPDIRGSIHPVKRKYTGDDKASRNTRSKVLPVSTLASDVSTNEVAEPDGKASEDQLIPVATASSSGYWTPNFSGLCGAQGVGIGNRLPGGGHQQRILLDLPKDRVSEELVQFQEMPSDFHFAFPSAIISLQDTSQILSGPLLAEKDDPFVSSMMSAKLRSMSPSKKPLLRISEDMEVLHEDWNEGKLPASKLEPQSLSGFDKDTILARSSPPIIERNGDIEPDDSSNSFARYSNTPQRSRSLPDYVASYLRTSWNNLTRPHVRPGHRRIEWICECGAQLYGDFDNSQPEAVDAIAEVVNYPRGATQSSTSSSPASTIDSTVARGSSSYTSSPNSSETSRDMEDVIPMDQFFASRSHGRGDPAIPKRYFELCVNHNSLEKRLGEVDISSVQNDGTFFRLIMDRYESVRGPRTSFLYLRKPVDVEYVRFTLEDRYRVWVFEKPLSWLSKEEVEERRWDFEHPLNPPPPMPATVFLHYLKTPEAHHANTWLPRLPKKLTVSILQEQAALPLAWGVNIIEGPNQAVILFLLAFGLSLSLLASVVWSVYKNDVAGGMAIGQYLVSMVAIVATLIAATWHNF
ncbi:hypothetical protein MMC18_007020 [Xylographa bjoerkii]|nr:hypothetical protein [Xylographa bjoerkii]